MPRISRFRPSPGMDVTSAALLVALGGVSFAAAPAVFRATTPGVGNVYTAYDDGPLSIANGGPRTLLTLS